MRNDDQYELFYSAEDMKKALSFNAWMGTSLGFAGGMIFTLGLFIFLYWMGS